MSKKYRMIIYVITILWAFPIWWAQIHFFGLAYCKTQVGFIYSGAIPFMLALGHFELSKVEYEILKGGDDDEKNKK